MILKVKRLKIRKKAYVRKSVAQIGSGILLILSHAGLTATTDSTLLDICSAEVVYRYCRYLLFWVGVADIAI